jgi:hypothetical protein
MIVSIWDNIVERFQPDTRMKIDKQMLYIIQMVLESCVKKNVAFWATGLELTLANLILSIWKVGHFIVLILYALWILICIAGPGRMWHLSG